MMQHLVVKSQGLFWYMVDRTKLKKYIVIIIKKLIIIIEKIRVRLINKGYQVYAI